MTAVSKSDITRFSRQLVETNPMLVWYAKQIGHRFQPADLYLRQDQLVVELFPLVAKYPQHVHRKLAKFLSRCRFFNDLTANTIEKAVLHLAELFNSNQHALMELKTVQPEILLALGNLGTKLTTSVSQLLEISKKLSTQQLKSLRWFLKGLDFYSGCAGPIKLTANEEKIDELTNKISGFDFEAKLNERVKVIELPFELPGIEAYQIKTLADVYAESINMNNCVDNYYYSALKGNAFLFSVYHPERCTLMLEISNRGELKLAEVKGFNNYRVRYNTKCAIEMALTLLKEVNRSKINDWLATLPAELNQNIQKELHLEPYSTWRPLPKVRSNAYMAEYLASPSCPSWFPNADWFIRRYSVHELDCQWMVVVDMHRLMFDRKYKVLIWHINDTKISTKKAADLLTQISEAFMLGGYINSYSREFFKYRLSKISPRSSELQLPISCALEVGNPKAKQVENPDV